MFEKGDQEFIEYLKSNIISHNKDILSQILTDPQFKTEIIQNGMDLLSVIYDNLDEKSIDESPSDSVVYKLINFIATHGNTKEIICVLNVYFEKSDKTDLKFLSLLYPLSIALPRLDSLSSGFVNILKESLNCAISHFDNVSIAHHEGLEGKELEVYIEATETRRLLSLTNSYLSFLETLMKKEELFNRLTSIRNEFLANILRLFDRSLIKLVFYCPGIVGEECRASSARAFRLAERCVRCWHEWLQRCDPILSESPSSSIVSILYHIFISEISGKFPQILLINYNWSICVPRVSHCLHANQNDPHAVRLGLRLLADLTARLENASVNWKKDKDSQMGLMRALQITATSNLNREIRGLALDCFLMIFDKFIEKARYKLLLRSLKPIDHPGFKGQLVLLLKREMINEITTITRQSVSNRSRRSYFTGASVYRLITDVFCLPDGDKTDLVHESEWILAALNLLYVVLRRDSKLHLVGLDVLISDIDHQFLKPLARTAQLSLAHYRREKIAIESDGRDGTSLINDDRLLDSAMGFMDKREKIDFIDRAILMIELVMCNIARVTDTM